MGHCALDNMLPNSSVLRTRFSQAMSDMYKEEVPAYGDLMSIVAEVDDQISSHPLPPRHRIERHGAIRLGTAYELQTIARLLSLFDMHPVGYYDLTVVGFPLHATAFRPLTTTALSENPFRMFTSLLRLDLLPPKTRQLAESALSKRNLFSDQLLALVEQAERDAFLSPQEEDSLLFESLKIFRWHSTATVPHETYAELLRIHPIAADIVSFPSAHINHLTPRTLNIDVVQERMKARGLRCKDKIEGPPPRACAILLRQTSFKAFEERVSFLENNGTHSTWSHTARFGEVEQRGAALTRKGRELYDRLLFATSTSTTNDHASGQTHQDALARVFEVFPDSWAQLRKERLVYFRYICTGSQPETAQIGGVASLSMLIDEGCITYVAIVYEDFLPISAAGIFTSNLVGPSSDTIQQGQGSPALLEGILNARIPDPTDLYSKIEEESIEECRKALKLSHIERT